ncbi:sulfotransferase domain-containing protein [Ketobacter sp. MCCC 1A13808]|uniref:sulfotransferase domain-containing protein n=1 Tax=Ketobacter sp. MCCC 1A13808 TaxID=2602738 RepID=UPI000F2958B5|nr:sulfotransferase domain-containing protein [Ketobacter sp. MCCC 1A13808]MVF13972.1 sulfotransferase domain-containing protein [Ketobacter sp. MCCC 1A13808]RLP53426.1 MAG: sulfotransferase [Ketobacter sp.]
MPKPTFIGIGAQKCASTWIYDILKDHPDVALSELKEVDFFSYKYDHGLQWYENNFSEAGTQSVIGEISPSYFHEPAVPARVYRHYPDIKLIVSLRDPIKRAVSNHMHEVRIGHLSGEDISFENGLANNPTYIEQGLYATHLERWMSVFPRENILILLFEDVIANREAAAKKIYQFLALDDQHRSVALDTRSNPSYVNRYKGLEKLRKGLRKTVKSLGLDFLWRYLAKMGLSKLYSGVNKVSAAKAVPPPKEATIQNLAVEFDTEITQLESILSRELSMWR